MEWMGGFSLQGFFMHPGCGTSTYMKEIGQEQMFECMALAAVCARLSHCFGAMKVDTYDNAKFDNRSCKQVQSAIDHITPRPDLDLWLDTSS
jgi:hypothetical protein